MKGVVIAGGLGTRLKPLTDPLNKHWLPVYDKPMIVHVVETLVQGGVDDILIVNNGGSLDPRAQPLPGGNPGIYLEMLEDGQKFGCDITYRYSRYVNGPGAAIVLAERWVGNEDFVLILGDSIFFTPLDFRGKPAPHMFVMELTDSWDDPQKYAQLEVSGNKVTQTVWKPLVQVSRLIQACCWIVPPDIFQKVKGVGENRDKELNVTAVMEEYVREGRMTFTKIPPRSYIDAGTIEALHKAAVEMERRTHFGPGK